LAGFSDPSVLGDLYAVRANDPRQKDVEEGNLSPIQVILYSVLRDGFIYSLFADLIGSGCAFDGRGGLG